MVFSIFFILQSILIILYLEEDLPILFSWLEENILIEMIEMDPI